MSAINTSENYPDLSHSPLRKESTSGNLMTENNLPSQIYSNGKSPSKLGTGLSEDERCRLNHKVKLYIPDYIPRNIFKPENPVLNKLHDMPEYRKRHRPE